MYAGLRWHDGTGSVMDPDASFFFFILTSQAVFTAAIVLIVEWRVPARTRLYRFIAPAALPVLMLAFAVFAAAQLYSGALPSDFARMALAYAVLWLAGVIFANLLLAIVRRFRR